MERHLRDSEPRWALVVWPDIPTYAEMPCCIPMTELDVAITAGAVCVGREDADFCKPRERVMPDLILLRLRFNHPYGSVKKPPFYPMRPPDAEKN